MTTTSHPTTSAQLPEWLVICPDFPNVLEKRLQVREQHFSDLPPKIESGFLKSGGATLDEPIQEGKDLQFNGSYMIAKSPSKEELLQVLKDDVYTRSGVWDLDNVQILPIKVAIPKS